ncbi:MAG TPA: hypothetical protein VGM19_14545 [Armatimonadota bacterium]|jgi:hypothetical protein
MKTTFVGFLWRSVRRTTATSLTVCAIFDGLALWKWGAKEIPCLWVAVLGGTVLVWLMVILIHGAFDGYSKAQGGLPKVIKGMLRDMGWGPTTACLLQPSNLFSHGIAVSFYHLDQDSFEELIGLGTITNIQADGKILAVMTDRVEAQGAIASQLADNNGDVVRKTVVKPHVPCDWHT